MHTLEEGMPVGDWLIIAVLKALWQNKWQYIVYDNWLHYELCANLILNNAIGQLFVGAISY